MSTIKKRQHYVWRNYLRSWADKKDHIWACKKDDSKILHTNLMNVAQEGYFYSISELADNEIQFIRSYIDNKTPLVVRPLCLDFLKAFISPYQCGALLTSKGASQSDIESTIRSMEINIFEEIHCMFEKYGEKIINCHSVENLQNMQDEDWDEALTYMMFQYTRTKKMKISVVSGLKEDSEQWAKFVNKVYPLMGSILAITIGRHLSIDTSIKIKLLENKSSVHFVTSDQPIMNFVGDISDDEGYAKQLELYYPLNPQNALYIHFRNDQTEKVVAENINEEQVKLYNQKMIENSHLWVFADSKKQFGR